MKQIRPFRVGTWQNTRLADYPTNHFHQLLHWYLIKLSYRILESLTQVTTCNSLLAIFAGLLSDLLVRGFSFGPLAPFLAALVLICLLYLVFRVIHTNVPPYLLNFAFVILLCCKSFLQPCLAAGLLMISLGWTENYGSQTGSLVEKYRQGEQRSPQQNIL